MARAKAKPEAVDLESFELLLAARSVPGAARYDGYRLKQWPMGMVTAYNTEPLEVDAGKMAVTARISTPTPDLSNDIVIGKGIDTSVHQLNPLVLLMHNPMCPVGKSADAGGDYTVRMVGEDTIATNYFFQGSLESEQTFRLVEMGALPGASVKIKPKSNMVEMVRGGENAGPFAVIKGCLLYEWSHVFFPDNPEALVVAIEKGLGGKPVVESLRNLFAPLLPVRSPIVTSGFVAKCAGDCQCAKCKGTGACVADKMPKLMSEGYSEDFAYAVANHICGNDETGDGTDDQRPTGATNMEDPRPHGAQYGSAVYEMSVALSEFAEEQSRALEPESAAAYHGIHESIHKLMKQVSEIHNLRYPDLPQLGMTTVDLDDPKPDQSAMMKKESDEFRKASRALVRGWWGERVKAVAEAEAEPVKEAVEFLTKAAAHRGPWSNAEKTRAAALARKLGAPAPKAEPPAPVPADDWSEVEARLKEREKALTPFADRAATFGAN